MPIKVLMPALSPTMTEGKLVNWTVSEGDVVAAGDVIAEIETDKATMEVEAVDEGKIEKIIIPSGTDGVPVNDIIAVILEEDEKGVDIDAFLSAANNDAAPIVTDETAVLKEEDIPAQNRGGAVENVNHPSTSRVIASPLAHRIAKDNNINLSGIKGSGPHGRIIKVDVEAVKSGTVSSGGAKQGLPVVKTTPLPQGSGPTAKELADLLGIPYHLEENSGIRKIIASRLLESKQTVPHYYLSVDCELDKLLAARKEINSVADGAFKLSVNDFILKASALALKKIPAANVSWTDEAMVVYDRADVSVAVATDGGLITPIIKAADEKSLRQISEEVKDLAARARENKLKPEEFQGGTISVSNLGMYGIKQFSAIINPPQACILAIGAGVQRPVVKDGKIVPATVMDCTASFDHRAIDGAVGAQFLAAFKDYIENPLSILA